MRSLSAIIPSVCVMAMLLSCGSSDRKNANPEITRIDTLAVQLDQSIQDGDIIFQTSQSTQSRAVQLATHSPYSHCGIVLYKKTTPFVLEAVEPVKWTRLEDWIARGQDGKFIVKRLKNESLLTQAALAEMREVARKFDGLHYDLYFGWGDERIYCSELVWKLYKRATDLELGRLQRLRDFDLTSAAVRGTLRQRYGNAIPLDDTVISPAAIFESPLLVEVRIQ